MAATEILQERADIDETVAGQTLVDLLERNARDRAEHPAIHWRQGEEWRFLTWSHYADTVRVAAAGLIDLGVERGDAVAIQASNRPGHVIADLGSVYAGATPVSFYNTLAREQIAYIADHCAVRVAILEDLTYMKRWEAIWPSLTELRSIVLMEGAENYDTVDAVISWDELLDRGRRTLGEHPELVSRVASGVRPDDLATLIYTSGTTGVPKGVAITHRNVLWTAESSRRMLGVDPGMRNVSYLPLAHIAERMATHYLGLHLAGEIYYCPDVSEVLDYVVTARPQLFLAVPRVWEKFQARLLARFAEDSKQKLISSAIDNAKKVVEAAQRGASAGFLTNVKHRLFDRLIFSKVRSGLGMDQVELAGASAAPISDDLLVFFRALGIPLYNIYGMTEATGPITANTPDADRIGSAGKAFPGVEVELADDGEIMTRGGNVASGYYRMPDETAATFDTDGWLLTGDLGAIDEDGFITIVGRKKEIIITAAGKNIAPATLEAIVVGHPLVAQACTVGDGRAYLTMIVALDADEAPVWARRHGVAFADVASFSQHPEVRTAVEEVIESGNQQVSRVEQIKKFTIVPDVWTPDSGEVTPKLSVRRSVVLGKYAAEIEAMYGG